MVVRTTFSKPYRVYLPFDREISFSLVLESLLGICTKKENGGKLLAPLLTIRLAF